MKNVLLAVMTLSSLALAAPPPAAGKGAPAAFGDERDDFRADRKAARERKVHLMLVVGIAEALGLSEAEALKMSDKLKGFEDKRRPVREAMGESMRILKAAADGDASAQGQVDAAVLKVLDGRQQMAALDKEMFQGLSAGLTPQRRAQLALFLAKFKAAAMGGGEGGKGRHRRDRSF